MTSNVPDKLIVLMNTDLPGASSIEYKPSMSIPNIASSYICFDPLVKITNSAIKEGTTTNKDKMIKFLDKGYFNSLIKDSKQFTKSKTNTLLQATQLGIVDNNIDLTLKTLFGNNSVIQINNKTYTIYSFEWEKQNWIIAPAIVTPSANMQSPTRQPLQPNVPAYPGRPIYYPMYIPPYMQNPLLHNKSYEHEYDKAKKKIEELMKISPVIVKGENYKKIEGINNPVPVAPSTTTTDVPYKKTPTQSAPLAISSAPTKLNLTPSPASVAPSTVAPFTTTTVVPYKKTPTQSAPLAISSAPTKLDLTPSPASVAPSTVSPSTTTTVVPYTQSSTVLPTKLEIEQTYDTVLNKEIPNKITKTDNKPIVGFLKLNSYCELVNGIYNRMYPRNETGKKYIIQQNQQFVIPSAKKTVMTISGIKLTTNSIKLQETPQNGNCLFEAISEAINLYNSNNTNADKITYNALVNGNDILFGTNTNPFTQLVVRRVLLDNLFTDQTRYQTITDTVSQYVHVLNESVETEIRKMNKAPTVDEIMDIVNNVYHNQYADMTFLIKKPDKITDTNINGPFFTVIPNNEVSEYILSTNYWGNELVFSFIQSYLKLSIIVIKKNTEQSNYSIAQESLSEQNEQFYPNINSWNKYMFVFLSGTTNGARHYEGVKFKTYTDSTESDVFYSIFDNNDKPTIIPPLCVLTFIYGSYYYTTPDKSKNLLLIPFLNEIDSAFENIINTPYTEYPRRYSKSNNPKTQVETFYTFFNIQTKRQYLTIVRENFAKVSWPNKTRKNEVDKLQTGGVKTIKNREQIDDNLVGGSSNSKLGYYVNITLYLYENDKNNPPGKIPFSTIPKMICKQNTNGWRASLAEILGVEQTIKTDYSRVNKGFVPQYKPTMHGGQILNIKNKAIQNKITRKKGRSISRLSEIKKNAIQNKLTRKIINNNK